MADATFHLWMRECPTPGDSHGRCFFEVVAALLLVETILVVNATVLRLRARVSDLASGTHWGMVHELKTSPQSRLRAAWLVKQLGTEDCVAKHVVACSTALDKTKAFGIDSNNVFGFWDWVGGRFSVWSAVGVLALSLQYGFDVVNQFLEGGHAMDQHFQQAPAKENMPLILGLLDVWNGSLLGYEGVAILPYCQALLRFVPHIQQLDMESTSTTSGLMVTEGPNPNRTVSFETPKPSGPSNGKGVQMARQHSFYQLLHQGRVVPSHFIGFAASQHPATRLKPRWSFRGEAVANHDELMSNFFAQPDALALGKTADELKVIATSSLQRTLESRREKENSQSVDAIYGALCLGVSHEYGKYCLWGVELGKVLAKEARVPPKCMFEAICKGMLGPTKFNNTLLLKSKSNSMGDRANAAGTASRQRQRERRCCTAVEPVIDGRSGSHGFMGIRMVEEEFAGAAGGMMGAGRLLQLVSDHELQLNSLREGFEELKQEKIDRTGLVGSCCDETLALRRSLTALAGSGAAKTPSAAQEVAKCGSKTGCTTRNTPKAAPPAATAAPTTARAPTASAKTDVSRRPSLCSTSSGGSDVTGCTSGCASSCTSGCSTASRRANSNVSAKAKVAKFTKPKDDASHASQSPTRPASATPSTPRRMGATGPTGRAVSSSHTSKEKRALALGALSRCLREGASPHRWDGPETPLRAAVGAQSSEMARLLIHARADPNEKDAKGVCANAADQHGQTAFFFAPSSSVCDILLEHKAAVKTMVKERSPLHLASRAGLSEVLMWFAPRISREIVDLRDIHGATAAYYARHAGVSADFLTKHKLSTIDAARTARAKPFGLHSCHQAQRGTLGGGQGSTPLGISTSSPTSTTRGAGRYGNQK
ncbi:unnamed protein product [Durusdinium trenchii]|uniref:Glucose-6-phosphate isomerase n=1 Tax=Durusdinium trenchii TaxID=1381693 RepID=A0ABP0RBL3_9DINO